MGTGALLARGPILDVDRLLLVAAIAGLQALANLFPLRYGPQTNLMLHSGVIFAAVLLFPPGVAMVLDGAVLPPQGRAYADRSLEAVGMIRPSGPAVRTFAEIG